MGDHEERDALAALLRAHRQLAGLSQRTLAEAAGIGERTVRELERGRVARPQAATLDRIAAALTLGPADRALLHRCARPSGGAAAEHEPGEPFAAVPRAPRVPLPADPPDLSGRGAELQSLLARHAAPGTTTVTYGPPGTGKTTVVVHAARRLAEAAPDGVFFVQLRGTAERATSVTDALAQLLTDFGVDRRLVPAGADERRRRFRELAAGRRAVLVLDDARDAEQVRDLLPDAPGWRVLISSRRRLAALRGVARLRLTELPDADALELLAGIVSPERLAAEPEATGELVAICGGLPLALRIAGSRLASRPDWTVGGLMDRLRDAHRRLDGLYAGDVEVRTAFTVSYRQLTPVQRRGLRRLALLPWVDADTPALADLLGTTPAAASAVRAGLAEAGLLTPAAVEGRFRLHDLLALFGRERAADEDGDDERDAALERVRSRLLATVVAGAQWFPGRVPVRAPFGFPPPRHRFASAEAALDWLQEQRAAIAWAVRRTAAEQRSAELVALVEAVRGLADRHHHLAAWDELFRLAVAAAQDLGDPVLEASLRNAVGFALKYQARRPEQALPEHERAMELYAEAGDAAGCAWSMLFTVGALHRSGRLPAALARARAVVGLFDEFGLPDGSRVAGYALGDVLRDLGRWDEAVEVHRAGLAALTHPDGADRVGAGMIGYRLGLDLLAVGRAHEAVDVLERALVAFRAAHHPTGAAECLGALAEALATLGSERATAVGAHAVRVCHEYGDLPRQAQAWYALALAADAQGRGEDHRRYWRRARDLCEESDLEGRRLAAKLARIAPAAADGERVG